MTRVVLVVPSIVPSMTVECLASLYPSIINPAHLPQPPTRQREPIVSIVNGESWTDGSPDVRLVVVWNTPEPGKNAGVAGSWNIGVDELHRTQADWLVILSAGVRFGESGGSDFLHALDRRQSGEGVPPRPGRCRLGMAGSWQCVRDAGHEGYCSGVNGTPPLGIEGDDGLGWHLLAFPRYVLETVGPFDTAYHPAYGEDLDYSRRIQLAYGIDSTAPDFVGPLWPKVKVDATLTEVAHGIKRGHVPVDFGAVEALHVRKWGAKSPDECFVTPYDDPALDWTFTGPHA